MLNDLEDQHWEETQRGVKMRTDDQSLAFGVETDDNRMRSLAVLAGAVKMSDDPKV